MFNYKICQVINNNGTYELKYIDEVFDNRASAVSWVYDADKHGYSGVQLTILEVYE